MKFLFGFLAGFATAYAVGAIALRLDHYYGRS